MSKFGWCLDRKHKKCREAIIRESANQHPQIREVKIVRCECTCHTEKETR